MVHEARMCCERVYKFRCPCPQKVPKVHAQLTGSQHNGIYRSCLKAHGSEPKCIAQHIRFDPQPTHKYTEGMRTNPHPCAESTRFTQNTSNRQPEYMGQIGKVHGTRHTCTCMQKAHKPKYTPSRAAKVHGAANARETDPRYSAHVKVHALRVTSARPEACRTYILPKCTRQSTCLHGQPKYTERSPKHTPHAQSTRNRASKHTRDLCTLPDACRKYTPQKYTRQSTP